jgi:hypothetical protein
MELLVLCVRAIMMHAPALLELLHLADYLLHQHHVQPPSQLVQLQHFLELQNYILLLLKKLCVLPQ